MPVKLTIDNAPDINLDNILNKDIVVIKEKEKDNDKESGKKDEAIEDGDKDKDKEQANDSINGWTAQNEEWFLPFLSRLKYYRTINNFYYFYLKRKEGQLSWCIIVISTLSSALSLVNTDENIFPSSATVVKWTLVLFTLITTLISAYIKKQQFIDNINSIDRYLQQLNQVVEEINITFILDLSKRENYDDFCAKYIPLIKKLSVFPANFSPSSWKRTVYTIMTKYPELIEGDGTKLELLWPWYHIASDEYIEEIEEDKKNRKTNFGDNVLQSYNNNWVSMNRITNKSLKKSKSKAVSTEDLDV